MGKIERTLFILSSTVPNICHNKVTSTQQADHKLATEDRCSTTTRKLKLIVGKTTTHLPGQSSQDEHPSPGIPESTLSVSPSAPTSAKHDRQEHTQTTSFMTMNITSDSDSDDGDYHPVNVDFKSTDSQ